jgi:hypothetical protein
MTTTTVPTTTTCPAWCREDAEHEHAHEAAVSLIDRGRLAVSLIQGRRFDRDDLGLVHPPELVELSSEDPRGGDKAQLLVCSPEEARSLAAAMIRAADTIEYGPR